jgi:hypothetical protein
MLRMRSRLCFYATIILAFQRSLLHTNRVPRSRRALEYTLSHGTDSKSMHEHATHMHGSHGESG